MKDKYTITQVAAALGRTRQRVHQLYKDGCFPGAFVEVDPYTGGKVILIPAADVEALKQRKGA